MPGRLFGTTLDRHRVPTQAATMDTTTITAGMKVVATDVDGHEHEMEALSGLETAGHSFPVVWVARPLVSGDTDRVPWPADAIRPA